MIFTSCINCEAGITYPYECGEEPCGEGVYDRQICKECGAANFIERCSYGETISEEEFKKRAKTDNINNNKYTYETNNKIDGKYWCSQCGHYYDYKEMADEKTCQECVYQTREFQKVDFKRLLESMPDEDIDEVINKMDNEILRDEIIDELDTFTRAFDCKENRENFVDRIIKLI